MEDNASFALIDQRSTQFTSVFQAESTKAISTAQLCPEEARCLPSGHKSSSSENNPNDQVIILL